MYETGSIVRTGFAVPAAQDRAAPQQGAEPICATDIRVDLDGLVEALEGHPEWNRYGVRRYDNGPHRAIEDLWVRYNAWENYEPDKGLAALNRPHTSVWYPVAEDVPQLKAVVQQVLDQIEPSTLGGVLITRIPPGGEVAPHRDTGWHAEYYFNKYAVQLLGHPEQRFHFEGHSLSPATGDVFWFNNQERHWVKNDSDVDRMTMIICTRPTGSSTRPDEGSA